METENPSESETPKTSDAHDATDQSEGVPLWRARLIATRTRLDDNRLEALRIKVDLFKGQLALCSQQIETLDKQIDSLDKQIDSLDKQ